MNVASSEQRKAQEGSPMMRSPSPPETERLISAIERLEARLERLEARLERFERDAPGVLATAADTVDEAIARLAARGVDVDARTREALVLLERLTAPETMRAITTMAEALTNLPHVVATVADTLDGVAAKAHDRGIDLDERLRISLRCAERLTSPQALETLELALARLQSIRLVLEEGVLDDGAVRLVSKAARAMAAVQAEGVAPAGPMAAMMALGRSDVRRSLGFLIRFAEQFGSALAGARPPELPANTRSNG